MLVSDIKKILAYLPDDLDIEISENRYCGGGDEQYTADFLFVEFNNKTVAIVPVPDRSTYVDFGGGAELNPDDFDATEGDTE